MQIIQVSQYGRPDPHRGATVSPEPLAQLIEDIADAAGYEGAFHISLSPDGYPGLFGRRVPERARPCAIWPVVCARRGSDIFGQALCERSFHRAESLSREGAQTHATKGLASKYSNHLMTDGRFVGPWLGTAGSS